MRLTSATGTAPCITCGGYTEVIVAAPTDRRPDAGDRRFRVTVAPLDVADVATLVADPGCGAVVTFVGLVRDHNAGRRVRFLEYECFEPLALKAFARIAAEAGDTWPDVQLAIAHRVGTLQVGEASVVIATASPHRPGAFAACRYAIERIKQIAPIWKHEHFDGGEVWIEGATADPDDERVRREAMARACA
jgi:molybdopterin synthase catalytic subunit